MNSFHHKVQSSLNAADHWRFKVATLDVRLLANLLALACLVVLLLGFGIEKAHAYSSGAFRTSCTQHGGTFVCTPIEFGTWTAFTYTCAGSGAIPGSGETPDVAIADAIAKVNSHPGCIAAGLGLESAGACESGTYIVESPRNDPINARFLVSCPILVRAFGIPLDVLSHTVTSLAACPQGRFAFSDDPFVNTAPTYCIYADNPKSLGAPDCCVGNPIDPRSGSKYQVETDLQSFGVFALTFVRYHSNFVAKVGPLGAGWRHHYERSIVDDTSGPVRVVLAFRADGKVIQFRVNSQTFTPDSDISDRLEQQSNGWRYVTAEGDEVERYDGAGRLVAISTRAGLTQSLTYDSNGRLGRITDPFGRSLTLSYNDTGRLTSMTDQGGNVYTYEYSADGRNNLLEVTYPSSQGSLVSRRYLYENSLYPTSLTGITDENGNRFATFSYDVSGLAVATEHAGGAGKITLGPMLSTSTSVTEFIDNDPPLSITRAYRFFPIAGVKKLVSIDGDPCPHCGPRSIQYGASGFVSRSFDWNNIGTTFNRNDPSGRGDLETQRIEASGRPEQRTISTDWHPTFRLPLRVAEPLRITTYVYNGDGGVTCGALPDGVTPIPGVLCSKTIQPTADANGSLGFSAAPGGTPRTWTYSYDGNGSLLTVDGPRTDVPDITTYTYYANEDIEPGKRGNVATISNALGHLTSFTAYNAHSQPLTIIDPNEMTSTLAYDERQRLKTRSVGGEVTSYGYDNVGQLTRVTLPDGSFLSYSYDAAHRLTGMQDNLGNRIHYVLDLKGNRKLEQVFDPANQLAQTRRRVFNNLNRLVQELGSQSQATRYTYDNQGNVASISDPLNRVTVNQYDALNRLRQFTDPALGITRYGYNGLDALTQVTDPRNLATSYFVDGLGNLNSEASPDTGTTTNTYDTAGNLLTRTDAKQQVTRYFYDALNRRTLAIFNNGSRHTYAYDQGVNGIGRLSSIIETTPGNQVNTALVHAYDRHGRVVSEIRTIAGAQWVTGYTYDSFGRMSGLSYPSGRTVTYGFDAAGRVSEISTTRDDQTEIAVQAVQYQPFGGVKSYTFGNGQVYARGIDLDGRISSYTLGSQIFAIGYDIASRISFISDIGTPSSTNTYGYDSLDRLTAAVLPGTPYAYSYDAVGNRLSRTAGSATVNYFYSSTSNRIASLTSSAGLSRNFVFDANGSTTSDGLNAYTYNVRGRMTAATSIVGTTGYQVNVLGQRLRKTNSVEDTLFHYDARGRLIAESAVGGPFKREYIYLGDIPVAVMP